MRVGYADISRSRRKTLGRCGDNMQKITKDYPKWKMYIVCFAFSFCFVLVLALTTLQLMGIHDPSTAPNDTMQIIYVGSCFFGTAIGYIVVRKVIGKDWNWN